VYRRYAAQSGSDLAALLTYYGFLAIFPMLLAGATVLGFVLRDPPAWQERVLSSSVADFPVIGADLRTNVHGLPGVSGLVTGLAVGLLGARGFCLQLQRAVDAVWEVPKEHRPSWLSQQLRTIWLIGLVGLGVVASATLTSVATTSAFRLLLLVVAVPGTAAVLLGVLRFVAPDPVPTRDLVVAAGVAAVGLVGMQLVGAQLVTHLTTSREVYGAFAAVLGLLAWIYLQAQVLVLAMVIGREARASRRTAPAAALTGRISAGPSAAWQPLPAAARADGRRRQGRPRP